MLLVVELKVSSRSSFLAHENIFSLARIMSCCCAERAARPLRTGTEIWECLLKTYSDSEGPKMQTVPICTFPSTFLLMDVWTS